MEFWAWLLRRDQPVSQELDEILQTHPETVFAAASGSTPGDSQVTIAGTKYDIHVSPAVAVRQEGPSTLEK